MEGQRDYAYRYILIPYTLHYKVKFNMNFHFAHYKCLTRGGSMIDTL